MLKITIRAAGSCARIRAASSKPDRPGRLMSITETSGARAAKAARPVSASCASKTSISGSAASRALQPETTTGWSSTIRTRKSGLPHLLFAEDAARPARLQDRKSALDLTPAGLDLLTLFPPDGWPMSLKVRIDLLFGLLLFLGLAADIGHMALNARARVQAEGAAMTRVTRDFVEAALVSFHGAPDPEESLRQLVRNLDSLRHVRIAFVRNGAEAANAALAPDEARREAPSWFFNLIHARNEVTILPAAIDGRPFGAVVIASDPADEVNEVWQDVRNLALTGGAIALAALFGASFILGRTLRPLETYSAALGRLSEGDYAVRAQAGGLAGIRRSLRQDQRPRRGPAEPFRRQSRIDPAPDGRAGRRAQEDRA